MLKILTRREAQYKRDEWEDEGMEMTDFGNNDGDVDFPGQNSVGDVFLPQGY